MTFTSIENEVGKLDPNGEGYDIFVKALRKFVGLTAEDLREYLDHHGIKVELLPQKGDR